MLDKELKKIQKAGKQGYKECLKQVLTTHGKLVFLYKKKVGKKHHSTRSFWSKYLHFHNRFVPIYDSRVTKNISELFSKDKHLKSLLKTEPEFNSKGVDRSYAKYVKKFFVLGSKGIELRDKEFKNHVKELDYFILRFNS